MPTIFNLPEIKFWQAAGLLLLFRLLFGFGHHWKGPGYYKSKRLHEKWEKMSPEERESMKQKFRERAQNTSPEERQAKRQAMRERWKKMSPEERQRLSDDFKNRGPHPMNEGKPEKAPTAP